jgi:hypothetical protein
VPRRGNEGRGLGHGGEEAVPLDFQDSIYVRFGVVGRIGAWQVALATWARILEPGYNFAMQEPISFDKQAGLCYKKSISPLLLRGQGARRCTTASAFLTKQGTIVEKQGVQGRLW